jgi:hypothetical protein
MSRVIKSDELASATRNWPWFPMTAHGRVQIGVIVLDDGVRLPEGQDVIVLAHGTVPGAALMQGTRQHSVLDISTVALGSVLRPLTPDDDLLGEMLEGRP